MNNMEQRFPDLGEVALTILESKLESVLGKEAIKKIRTPLEKKELREKLVGITKKAESKTIDRYPNIGSALKELSIAEITPIKNAIVAFYENPTTDDTIREIESQIRVILPQNHSQDEIVEATGFYFYCLREELTALAEIREQLGVISAIRIEKKTEEMTEILRSIDKKIPEINNKEYPQSTSQNRHGIGEFPFPATLFFVGQNNVLEEINKAVSSNNILLIGGMPGIGKTYITARFIEIHYKSQYVLWQDWNASNQLEQFLIRLAEFFISRFNDNSLMNLLKTPSESEQRRLDVAVSLVDKHNCCIIWDNFDVDINHSVLPLLLAFSKSLRVGKLLITTRKFFDLHKAINPISRVVVPRMSQDAGLELMMFYLDKLGLPDQPQDILIKAYERVDGHPYFMRSLIVLSESFPLDYLLQSLPQFQTHAFKYIQEEISNQLDSNSRRLLQNLSVFRKPFGVSAIDQLVTDVEFAFEKLIKKFLVTRQNKTSSNYEIHDLVKEFELSRLSPDELISAHANAAHYYLNLDAKSYSDGIELINHRTEERNYQEAEDAANNLLGSALHAGLFDLVIDVTNQLIEEKLLEDWGQIYFSRGRAFRLKGELAPALENYRIAQAKSKNEFIKESALLEISSMLAQQVENIGGLVEAIKFLNDLIKSKDIKIKTSALTSLGYLNLKSTKTRKLGMSQLKEALRLAESEGLQRNIMQICHGLGQGYFNKNNLKNALIYLERSRSTRDSIRDAYGEQDIEADYHLFDLLANVYRKLKRYDDAINSSEVCVRIDRKYKFHERLAASLYQTGQDLCLLKKYKDAQAFLRESLEIINKQNLGHVPKKSTVEWLAVAVWYSNQFEIAIELILEYISLNQKDGKGMGKHIVNQENDLRNPSLDNRPEFIEMNGEFFHLLVLPKEFTFQDVKQWNENVVKRRPDLAKAYNPVLLYNK